MTKLSAKLPKGDGNGIAPLAQAVIADPFRIRVVVALVDCTKITKDVEAGSNEPTLRIRRIESISDPEDQLVLRRLLQREFERRTGRQVLPYNLEQDVMAAFGGPVDLDDDTDDRGDGD